MTGRALSAPARLQVPLRNAGARTRRVAAAFASLGILQLVRVMAVHGSSRAAKRSKARNDTQRGQGLVEFALVFPIFILMLMATIEFGLAFNAVLDVDYASRNAALLAAEAGNTAGADCVILESVEADIGVPASDADIQAVDIYWADPDGGQKSGKVNHYLRGGSTTCAYRDGSSLTVPYSAASLGYVDTSRCNALKGCGSTHPGLDTVGVKISYIHRWRTPMAAAIPGIGPGSSMSFSKSNAMRMEPIL